MSDPSRPAGPPAGRRDQLAAVAAAAAAILYGVSPVDVLPELMLGPLGLADDVVVLAVAALFVVRRLRRRRQSPTRDDAGPDPEVVVEQVDDDR